MHFGGEAGVLITATFSTPSFAAWAAGRNGRGGFDDRAAAAALTCTARTSTPRYRSTSSDSYSGATRKLQLRMPVESESGLAMQDRSIEFVIPKGIRAGQHIRLAGQGAPGMGKGGAGDLYLDVEFLPHKPCTAPTAMTCT
jgi:curved DNA-binding protein